MHTGGRDVLSRMPRQRVVQREHNPRTLGKQRQDKSHQRQTDTVRLPCPATEEPMKSGVLVCSDDAGSTHHPNYCVLPDAQDPSCHKRREPPVAGARETAFKRCETAKKRFR